MEYRRLKNGTHAVGFRVEHAVGSRIEKRFIVWTSAFDAREAKALVKAIGAVMDLFFATSGGYVTMVGDEEIPRGATAKVAAKEKLKAAAIANRKLLRKTAR